MRVEKTQAMGFNNTHIVMGIPREIQDSEKSFKSESSFHTVEIIFCNYDSFLLFFLKTRRRSDFRENKIEFTTQPTFRTPSMGFFWGNRPC